jgi:DNA-binding SARP family transcriptional activator/predicted ATPase
VAAILAVLGLPARDVARGDQLAELLTDHQLLLVLDRCEHLGVAAARLVDALVDGCPHVKVLVTSREAPAADWPTADLPHLSLAVRPMAVPPTGWSDPSGAEEFDAVRLFKRVAQASNPRFRLDESNLSDTIALCQRLDGLPLALQLVAAHSLSLSPAQLAEHVGSLLSAPRAPTPGLSDDLHGVMEWSYRRLAPTERAAHEVLSVFAGGFSLEAAADLLGCLVDGADASFLVDGLARRSLLEVRDSPSGRRFHMLDAVRTYALSELESRGATTRTRDAHVRWVRDLVERCAARVPGAAAVLGVGEVSAEMANVREAMDWALQRDPGMALGLAAAIAPLLWRMGDWSEARGWLRASLDAGPAATAGAAAARRWAGRMARELGDYEEAQGLLERARAGYEAAGDGAGVAQVTVELGAVAVARFDPVAPGLLEEGLEACRRVGDRAGQALAHDQRGFWELLHDRKEEARSSYEQALGLWRSLGDELLVARALARLGQLAYLEGRHPRARGLYEEAVETFRAVDDPAGLADALVGLANAEFLSPRQNPERARQLCEEAVGVLRRIGDKRNLAWALYVLAEVARDLRDLSASGAAAQEALALARGIGLGPLDTLPLFSLAELAFVEGRYGSAADLGRQALAGALEVGLELHVVRCLESLARTAAAGGDVSVAARLLGHVEAAREGLFPEERAAVRQLHEVAAARARTAHGGPQAWSEGRASSREQAVALALGDSDPGDSITSRALEIHLLGGFSAFRDGNQIDLSGIVETALAIMALRRSIHVEELAELLWPEAPEGVGRARLRNVVSRIRAAAGPVVDRDGDLLRLSVSARTDVEEFEHRTGLVMAARERGEATLGELEEASRLYPGELLPGHRAASWASGPRERLVRRYIELLDALADVAARSGETARAVEVLEQAIELDPYDEARSVRTAEMLLDRGWPGRAAAVVRRAAATAADLGVAPSDSLRELQQRLIGTR